MKHTVEITKKELLDLWADNCTEKEWIENYKRLSDSFCSWELDLRLAEFIVNRVKEGYIEKYMDGDIPEVLRPLLIKAISDDIRERNKLNKDITLEEVSSPEELAAIRRLRDFKALGYNDGVNLFCEGYDYAMEYVDSGSMDLSGVSDEELINELKSRL